jgi:hypothetical protein
MTAFDYSEITAVATSLIEEFGGGATATLDRRVKLGTDYDPTLATESYDVKAVMTGQVEWDKDASGLIRRDELYIATDGEAPQMHDRLTFGGVTYSISRVNRMSPDGTSNVVYAVLASST